MCANYIPPIESPNFNNDRFFILEGEINHFQAQGHVLVCGDLNVRTGQEHDTLSTQGDRTGKQHLRLHQQKKHPNL